MDVRRFNQPLNLNGLVTGVFPYIDEEKNEYKEKPKRVFVTDIENIHSTRAAEKNRKKKMWTSSFLPSPEIKMEHHSDARDEQRKNRIEAAKKDPKLELSILEHYQSLVGEHRTVCDHGNNGFNTLHFLNGGNRNVKVKSYPARKYHPLEDNIQDFRGDNTKIIVDVGGSNIRELLAELKSTKTPEKNVKYALQFLREEYKRIIARIRQHNPNARIILATPHYPFVGRKKISEIYHQIKHLGLVQKIKPTTEAPKGSTAYAYLVVHQLYNNIFSDLFGELSKSDHNISVMDVASSLSPFDHRNFDDQELSSEGARKKAKMLVYMTEESSVQASQSYRFLPGFFQEGGELNPVNVITNHIQYSGIEHPQTVKNEWASRALPAVKGGSSKDIVLRVHKVPGTDQKHTSDNLKKVTPGDISFYTHDEEEIYKNFKHKSGDELLRDFATAMEKYDGANLSSHIKGTERTESHRLYRKALVAQKALLKLPLPELNTKQYKMAIALSVQALNSKDPKDAEILENYVKKAMAVSYMKYVVGAALLLLAAAAFTVATIFTLGTAPIVAAAIAVGVKTAIVSAVGYGVGSVATASIFGIGLHSIFKPTPNKEMNNFSHAMTALSKRTRGG